MDKGVDGFRVDAVNFVYENDSYPDEPLSHKPYVQSDEYEYLDHIYSQNQLETYDLVADWRSILDKYSEKGSAKYV